MKWETEAADLYIAMTEMLVSGEATLREIPPIYLHNLYMISSCVYYRWGSTMMPDALYDRICQELHRRYDEIKAVIWWPQSLLDPELLSAGSGYSLDYPKPVLRITEALVTSLRSQGIAA